MEDYINQLAYIGYVAISTAIAYPLLKWRAQHPKSFVSVIELFFINLFFLGLIPLAPFLMKPAPKWHPKMSAAESIEYSEYHERGKIWLWSKPGS